VHKDPQVLKDPKDIREHPDPKVPKDLREYVVLPDLRV